MAGRGWFPGLLLLFGLLFTAGAVAAEPLRLLVPAFFGPEPLSQQVRTSLYFEMIKAFSAIDAPDKGAWILYGEEPAAAPTHDAILATAAWPSVRADLAIWGQVHAFDDGVVLQLYLSLTPLLRQRQVRPELWSLTLRGRDRKQYQLSLDLPGRYYAFEPVLLSREAILQLSTPQGIRLYSARQGGEPIGSVGEVMRFYEIYDDALLIATDGRKGWVHTRAITRSDSEALAFAKGMVRLLRGDWRGAQQSFAIVLANPAVPQGLRIQALLYTGLAMEKGGGSGRKEFEAAYRLNRLDRSAAAYLLMNCLADLARMQAGADSAVQAAALARGRQTLNTTRPLFAVDDPWLHKVEQILGEKD